MVTDQLTVHDELHVVVREFVDGVSTIAVSGELDRSTCNYLHLVLFSLAELPEVEHVIVDLSELTFMDSSGLSTIVAARHRLAELTGASLRLTGATGSVLRVLEITGLDGYLGSSCSDRPVTSDVFDTAASRETSPKNRLVA